MSDIACGIGSDKASVTRMVNSLVTGNFLERRSSDSDHRETVIHLGKKAKTVLPEIEKIYSRLSEEFAGELSSSERKTLLILLKKIEPRIQRAIATVVEKSYKKESL